MWEALWLECRMIVDGSTNRGTLADLDHTLDLTYVPPMAGGCSEQFKDEFEDGQSSTASQKQRDG